MHPPASSTLTSKQSLLDEARKLLAKRDYSHMDASRVQGLLGLARESIASEERSAQDRQNRAFENLLRRGDASEFRDMNVSTGGGGGFLVAQLFRDILAETMKAYDALFDEAFVTHYVTATGAPAQIPASDDVMNSATIVAENAGPDNEKDPVLQQVLLPAAPTYRTGRVNVSIELLQDSAFDITTYLAGIFAKRLARGIGPNLVSVLQTGVTATATAVGSAGNTGGSETGGHSVGSDDLFAVMALVDPAYLSSDKAAWMMSWPTLLALWKLRDHNGRLVFPPEFDNDGTPMLVGFRVGICPSLPAVAPNAVPIFFGDFAYFCTRLVLPLTTIIADHESKMEYGLATFRALLRGQGCLLVNSGSTTVPIAGLKNAATELTKGAPNSPAHEKKRS